MSSLLPFDISAMARFDIMSILTFPIVLTILLSYTLILFVYRLYLSPIAKFPGPKLAALTHWYEVYFDVIQNGKFIFHVQKLHARYGQLYSTLLHLLQPNYVTVPRTNCTNQSR